MINPPTDLRGKFLESLGSKRAFSPLRGCRQKRGHGEVKPRVKCDGLIRDPEITIELFNLTAQCGEVAPNTSGIADIVVRTEETIECGFDER